MELVESKTAEVAINNFVKRVSLEHFHNFKPDANLCPLEENRDLSNDHWVSSVLITTDKASINFRIHFSSVMGKQLLADAFGESPAEFSHVEVQDFLKEFCNVIVGQVKTFLSSESDPDNPGKVFVPEIEPSYDEYGVVNKQDKPTNEDWWKIVWDDQELVLCSEVNCGDNFTAETLKQLSNQGILSVTHDGKVESI